MDSLNFHFDVEHGFYEKEQQITGFFALNKNHQSHFRVSFVFVVCPHPGSMQQTLLQLVEQ